MLALGRESLNGGRSLTVRDQAIFSIKNSGLGKAMYAADTP